MLAKQCSGTNTQVYLADMFTWLLHQTQFTAEAILTFVCGIELQLLQKKLTL